MNLCDYKNIFGEPKKNIHSYRLFNIAIIDVIATLLVGFVIAKYFNENIYFVLLILFMLGIILHKLFCVNTTINNLIF